MLKKVIWKYKVIERGPKKALKVFQKLELYFTLIYLNGTVSATQG